MNRLCVLLFADVLALEFWVFWIEFSFIHFPFGVQWRTHNQKNTMLPSWEEELLTEEARTHTTHTTRPSETVWYVFFAQSVAVYEAEHTLIEAFFLLWMTGHLWWQQRLGLPACRETDVTGYLIWFGLSDTGCIRWHQQDYFFGSRLVADSDKPEQLQVIW